MTIVRSTAPGMSYIPVVLGFKTTDKCISTRCPSFPAVLNSILRMEMQFQNNIVFIKIAQTHRTTY